MTTYTSQRDTSGVDDCIIREKLATTNYGTTDPIIIGYGSATSTILRALYRFDLSLGTNPPPAGAVVQSASITLNCSAAPVARTLAFYQCLRAWVEAQATWNIWKTSNNWSTAGAASDGNDYASTELGSLMVNSTGSKVITLNASGIAVVQGWINDPSSNCGFVARHTAETTGNNSYDSAENGTAGNRPLLTIEYTPNRNLSKCVFIG
jgi:hypothetical protein